MRLLFFELIIWLALKVAPPGALITVNLPKDRGHAWFMQEWVKSDKDT